jgi:hypothetical protein
MTSLFLPAPIRRNAKTSSNPNPPSSTTSSTTTSNQSTTRTSNPNHNYSSSSITTATRTPTNTNQDPHHTTQPRRAPTYQQRCLAAIEFAKLPPAQRSSQKSKLFVPRSILDFDDGGAFPEIHVAQYPKHMGNPHKTVKGHPSHPGHPTDQRRLFRNNNNSNHAILDAASSVSTTQALATVQIDAHGNKDYTSLLKGGTNTSRKVYAHYTDLKGYHPSQEELSPPLPTTRDRNRIQNTSGHPSSPLG